MRHSQLWIQSFALAIAGLGLFYYGPLMLELNARPGISIQIANRAGLRFRLEAVERWLDAQPEFPNVKARVVFARDHFAAA